MCLQCVCSFDSFDSKTLEGSVTKFSGYNLQHNSALTMTIGNSYFLSQPHFHFSSVKSQRNGIFMLFNGSSKIQKLGAYFCCACFFTHNLQNFARIDERQKVHIVLVPFAPFCCASENYLMHEKQWAAQLRLPSILF